MKLQPPGSIIVKLGLVLPFFGVAALCSAAPVTPSKLRKATAKSSGVAVASSTNSYYWLDQPQESIDLCWPNS